MGMNCKCCGCYIGEYSGHGRPRCYCDLCLPENNKRRLKKHLLGTTDIEAKMSRDKDKKPDFKKEANILKKEMRKLRLRK
jgi:hypothetical protein